ncbi:hypothetical protein G9C98_001874 [Cotesia typhae]|uniref:Uncharacterized protein n=1 Tax=Cotesia typhae TaxID=2053667 RepID=A0A8J5QXP8_9HYME|nr:hypothetical protein G9C98_001874 [Cotesia typhae]
MYFELHFERLNGAEINLHRRNCPETLLPLHLAVDCGNYDIAKFLVMSGAHVNGEVHAATFINAHYNFSALNLAISKKDIRLVKLLLDNKAIIDGGSREVYSSLHLAARTNRVDILQILEQYGAKFEVIKDQEYTSEFIAALRQDNVDILHVFTRNCDNILDISDFHGDTVAHLEVQLCCVNIMSYLLNCGTNINVINDKNSSLLDMAMKVNIDPTLNNFIVDETLDMIKLIEAHIIKLSVAGVFVSKRNLRAVDSDFFKSFQEDCKEEVTKLKSKRISKTNLYYYNVVEKNLHKLAVGLKYVDDYFDDEKILTEFPIYGQIIIQKLRQVLERKDLLKNSEKLYDIFRMDLPDLVVRNICNYLSILDLRLLSE